MSTARTLGLAAAALGLVAAAIAGTVVVEHRLHGHPGHGRGQHEGHDHGAEDGHGDHPGHEDGGGEPEERRVTLTAAMLENAHLELLTAGPGKVGAGLKLPGEVALNADATAHVSPRVAGAVREVRKQLGDSVKKGEVLAVLDSRELADLQREVLTAKERLSLAESSFKRQETLWQEKITSEREYLAAKQALAEARIEHQSAARKLAAGGGVSGGGYPLVAPLDGTIVEKHLNVGEVVSAETEVFTISDLSLLWVNATVYPRELGRVQVGQAARVRADSIEDPASGTVAYVSHLVREQTRSATARVALPRPSEAWRPGLFVTVEIALAEADAAIVVADDAVQRIDGKEVVFVQEGDTFEARRVALGRSGVGEGNRVVCEVLSGVAAGERYAGKNSFVLKAELGKSEAGHDHAH
jgi:cobalt-zinc-cadmium efflux system membrane fusion protein